MTIPIRASEATLIEVRQALQRIELNRQTGVQNNFVATADPTVTDDESSGYSAGSEWFNATDDKLFRCTDATTGAAVWVNVFGSGEVAGTGHNYGKIATSPASELLEASGKTDTFTLEASGGITITGVASSNILTIAGAAASHKDTHDPNDGSDPLDTAVPAELVGVQSSGVGTSHSFARADHSHLIQHSIADNHLVTIDGTVDQPVNDDYAKFTVAGLEGRSYAEVLSDIGGAAAVHTHAATEVSVSEIGTATYDDVQDFINLGGGSGVISGCEITENVALDGTIDIAAGTGWIRDADSATSNVKFFDIAATSGMALTGDGVNYVYIDYNSGTPQVASTQTVSVLTGQTFMVIGLVTRDAGHVHIVEAGQHVSDMHNKITRRYVWTDFTAWSSGLAMAGSDEAGHVLGATVTAGKFWVVLKEVDTDALDTGHSHAITAVNQGTKTFTVAGDQTGHLSTHGDHFIVHGSTGNDGTYGIQSVSYTGGNTVIVTEEAIPDATVDGEIHDQVIHAWYRDGGGGWTQTHLIAMDVTHYDDGDGTLGDLTTNRYAANWMFMDFDGHLHMVYGQGNYTSSQADAAALPSSLPPVISGFSISIAEIIIQKDETDLDNATILTPFMTPFAQSSTTVHNDLGGLQGGTAAQYYHLTAAEHTELAPWLAARDIDADGTKLDGIEALADVTDATNVNAAGAVMESDFGSHALLKTELAGPVSVTVNEQTLVGRITVGAITGLTATQVRTLLNIEDGADVTDATNVAAAGAIMDGDITGNGLMIRTAAGAYTNRSIAVADAKLTVSNADGVAGNPTLGFGSVALADLSDGGTIVTADANLTDDYIVRGKGGSLGAQTSLALLSDAGALSGLTRLTVDNLVLDATQISTSAGDLVLSPFGAGQVNLNGNLDMAGNDIKDDTRAYVRVDDRLYVTQQVGILAAPIATAGLLVNPSGGTVNFGIYGGCTYTGNQGAYGLLFVTSHDKTDPTGNQSAFGAWVTSENKGVSDAARTTRAYGAYLAAENSSIQDNATGNAHAYGLYVVSSEAGSGVNTAGNFYGYGLFVEAPAVPGGARTTNQEWGALFEAAVQINSDIPLILEGSATVQGDSYIIFNSANQHIEFWIDGVLEGYVDGAGFNNA